MGYCVDVFVCHSRPSFERSGAIHIHRVVCFVDHPSISLHELSVWIPSCDGMTVFLGKVAFDRGKRPVEPREQGCKVGALNGATGPDS